MEENEVDNRNIHYSVIESGEAKRQIIAKYAILLVLTLERLAYYALSASFFLFLNKGPWDTTYSWSTVEALNAGYFLTGVSYLSALLGGYISDSWLGRFRSIVFGFVLYIVGYVLITLIAVDQLPRSICTGDGFTGMMLLRNSEDKPQAPCKAIMYIAMTILGIGTGTVKSNVAPFGAEQLRTASPQRLRSFFNWFYWCVNIGSIAGIGAIAFIEQDSPGVCTNGFFCGYLIATVCLCIALFLFLCAYPWFYIVPAEGSLLGNIFSIIYQAIKANFRHWRYNRQNPNFSPLHVEPAFLDRAKIRYGGSFHEAAVDDVGSLGKLLAVFAALIPYWIVCFQMETSFQVQGLHMRFAGVPSSDNETIEAAATVVPYDVPAEHKWKFSVPAAWLTLFNQAFVIISIPLLTSFLYPRLDRSGFRISLFFRIGLGMVFSTLAVMTAGGLESYRTFLWRTDNSSHIDQVIGNVTYHAVDISIFWQIPQYVLVGAAEVFANIAGLEFAYSASPGTFQSLIMGLFYSLEGCASFLGSFLLQLVEPFWFNNETDYNNINDNHLDFYLYFLGVIQFTTLAIFLTILYVRRFTLKLVVMPPPHANQRLRTSQGLNSSTLTSRERERNQGSGEGEVSTGDDSEGEEEEERQSAVVPEDRQHLL